MSKAKTKNAKQITAAQNGTEPEGQRTLTIEEARQMVAEEIERMEAIPVPAPVKEEIAPLVQQIQTLQERVADYIRLGAKFAGAPEGSVCYHTGIGYVMPSAENEEAARRLGPVIDALPPETVDEPEQ